MSISFPHVGRYRCDYTVDENEVSPVTVQTTSLNPSYSVKIINPSKKTAYSVWKLRVNSDFDTPEDIKQQLCESFSEHIPNSDADLEIGYIRPGHGARGQQRWIIDNEDVKDMYCTFTKTCNN